MTKEEELFDQNINIAYKIANKYKINYFHEYEDIKQVALMGLWKACQTYNESYTFSTYAYAVIHNNINYYLRHVVRHQKEKSFNDIFTIDSSGDEIEYINTIEDDKDEIEDLIFRLSINDIFDKLNLSDRDRQIINMRRNKMSQMDISKKLNISQPQVSRIQIKLKKKIDIILNGI